MQDKRHAQVTGRVVGGVLESSSGMPEVVVVEASENVARIHNPSRVHTAKCHAFLMGARARRVARRELSAYKISSK